MGRVIDLDDAIEAIAGADETDGTEKVFSGKGVQEILKQCPTIDRWISVTERLPELNKEVLIQYKDRKDEMEAENMFYGIARRRIEPNFHFEDWSRYTEYQGYYEVVAWMPLPKPYEGSEEE